jgi:class 3 adenylate cyclase
MWRSLGVDGIVASIPVARCAHPKNIAEKIAIEGECKQVAVLFADLKGSMELLTNRGIEEVRKILDPAIERTMKADRHYEGTV